MGTSNGVNKQLKKYYLNKKVLVTGGAGFIGSHLVEALLLLGAKVSVITRPGSKLWRLDAILPKIKIHQVNLTDHAKIKKIIRTSRPEIIFNLAATVGGEQTAGNLREVFNNNVLTTVNLMQAAQLAKVDKFVQVGTILEYGDQKSPYRENNRESAVSPYSLSKILATHTALFLGKSLPLNVVVVRPAATFGPKQGRGMLTPNLILSALAKKDFDMNAGEQKRDLVFVADLVQGLLFCSKEKQAVGEIINLGANRGFKIKQVANLANALLGKPIKINFGATAYRPLDTRSFFMSSAKASRLLHWQTKTPLGQALRITIDWYKKNHHLIK